MPLNLCAGTAVQDINEREAVHNLHDSACPVRKDKALQTTPRNPCKHSQPSLGV